MLAWFLFGLELRTDYRTRADAVRMCHDPLLLPSPVLLHSCHVARPGHHMLMLQLLDPSGAAMLLFQQAMNKQAPQVSPRSISSSPNNFFLLPLLIISSYSASLDSAFYHNSFTDQLPADGWLPFRNLSMSQQTHTTLPRHVSFSADFIQKGEKINLELRFRR